MIKKFHSIFWNKKTVFILFILILLFQTQSYRLKSKKRIPPFVQEKLKSLGEKALLNNDVPILQLYFTMIL